jgi:type II secretory pathway pseudopilin PulG
MTMKHAKENADKRQRGAALLLTMVVLALVGMLAVTAIQRSAQESSSSARSRAATRSLYGADSGLQVALTRLSDTPPNLTPIDITLSDGRGGNTAIRSKTREDTSAQILQQVGTGSPPDGYAVNVGSGSGHYSKIYLVTVTADSGGSIVELEAKLSRSGADAGGY